ncbi:hypothetical protein QR680_012788 [Steinernema hermaphroditum]|uniref:Small ribosomal subunit protein mS23 n=1 Tax=Steinernema hermaphroditum TaxID=289476 RepID=A0AA39M0F1_9BILA|nr:hypothetical protein QR680_012788 [Steinernema hermaphroditum]
MASFFTRAERSGSIFFRVTGLIRSGQLKWENRPLWYDVYAAVPPLREPNWDAKWPKHSESVRELLYEEDIIRARFYKTFRASGAISIENKKSKSISQLFIEQYNAEREENPTLSEDEVFVKTTRTLVGNGIDLVRAPQ